MTDELKGFAKPFRMTQSKSESKDKKTFRVS